MTAVIIQIESLACSSCLQQIEATVKALEGVDQEGSRAMFNTSKFKVVFDEQRIQLAAIEQAITALGYQILYVKSQ